MDDMAMTNQRIVGSTGLSQAVRPVARKGLSRAILRGFHPSIGSGPVVPSVEPVAGSTGWGTLVVPVARRRSRVGAEWTLAGSTGDDAGSTAAGDEA